MARVRGVDTERRFVVMGGSGAGKTTLARELAAKLGAPHIELDALHWGPGWTPAAAADLRASVAAATRSERWVVDGNYRNQLGNAVLREADAVVWVNPPRRVAVWRCAVRSLRRALTRETLWNGNRESLGAFAVWRGEEALLCWAWISHDNMYKYIAEVRADPALAHLRVYRLSTRREVAEFLAGVASGMN